MNTKIRPRRFRQWAARLTAGTFAILIVVPAATLRPVDRADWSKIDPIEEAVRAAVSIREELANPDPFPLEAGWAAIPLKVAPGDPLAGYGARKGAPSTVGGETLFARALYLRNQSAEIVFVTADLLLVHAGVADAVALICSKSGIDRKSIYFTATHTHCGPGGWGPNLIEESVCGDFDSAIVERIALDLSRAIMAAKESAEPAEWDWLETTAPEFVRNRTVKGGITDPVLESIAVRKLDSGSIGLFSFFGAHATCLGSEQMSSHADYPGVFVREMEKGGVGFAAFGASSVGSQSPVGRGEKEQRARTIGTGLADKLLPLVEKAEWKRTVALGTARQTVPLPDFQIRISGNLRVAEWIANGIHPTTAPIHFVQLDNHRLIGLPVEYSALLSAPLREEANRHGIAVTPTAFNGDYIGYVLPLEIYDNGAYETRMNFLGPGGGAFFTRLIRIGTGLEMP